MAHGGNHDFRTLLLQAEVTAGGSGNGADHALPTKPTIIGEIPRWNNLLQAIAHQTTRWALLLLTITPPYEIDGYRRVGVPNPWTRSGGVTRFARARQKQLSPVRNRCTADMSASGLPRPGQLNPDAIARNSPLRLKSHTPVIFRD